MTRTILAAFCGATALCAASSASAYRYDYHTAVQRVVVTVSCYRGPWDDVIWDRPNPVFVDSLVSAGYSFPEAHAIAERVCRDPSTVGSPEGMRAVMNRILVETPPAR